MAPLIPLLMANKNLHRLIKEAKSALPLEQAFLADFISTIERYEQENARKPSKSYKPSSMTCLRNMYFQVTGEETDGLKTSYQLTGMGETGTARHEALQFYTMKMKDFGIDCEYLDVADYIAEYHIPDLEVIAKEDYETLLYNPKLNMRFKSDGLIRYKKQLVIIEYKTESTHKETPRVGYAQEHEIQGTCYSTNLHVDDVLFLYENRDNCHKKAFMLHVTPEMKMDLVINRIEECDGYVKRMIPPPKEKDLDKKTCNYCKYKKACRKAGI